MYKKIETRSQYDNYCTLLHNLVTNNRYIHSDKIQLTIDKLTTVIEQYDVEHDTLSIPLVTIITPYTKSRELFLPLITQCVTNQTYTNIEWLQNNSEIDTLGEKRNELCKRAKGDYIINFDSDDWYAPTFIEESLKFLLNTSATITGLHKMYFINESTKESFLFNNNNKDYVIGSGMLYTKLHWEQNNFRNITRGEDSYFVATCNNVKPHNLYTLCYARLHDDNSVNNMFHKHLYTLHDYKTTMNIFNK